MAEQQREEILSAIKEIDAIAARNAGHFPVDAPGQPEIHELCGKIEVALGNLSHAEGDAVAQVIPDVIGVSIAWIEPPASGRPPPGTKLYTHPAPQVAVPDGWTDRHTRITRFALWRLINEGYHRANIAAQKGQPGTAADAAALLDDVKRAEEARNMLTATPTAPAGEQHLDDTAVDRFAAAMKAKLAKKRAEGRGGWQTASEADLSALLHEHVAKGDPLDVANLAMMLHQNGQRVAALSHAEGEAPKIEPGTPVMTPDGPAVVQKLYHEVAGSRDWWVRFVMGIERWYAEHNLQVLVPASQSPAPQVAVPEGWRHALEEALAMMTSQSMTLERQADAVTGIRDLLAAPTAPAGKSDGGDICEQVELPHVLAWADGIRGDMCTEYADRITDEEARVAQAVWAAHTGEQPVSDPDGLEPGLAAEAAKHLTSWLDMDLCDCEGVCRCGRTHVRACRDRLLEAAAAPAPDEREVAELREDAERYRWLRNRDLETIGQGGVFAGMTPENYVVNGSDLDAAVDAARLRAGKEEGDGYAK